MTHEQRSRLTALVAALRSGKYKQAIREMRASNGPMCVLGVARELLGVNRHWAEWATTTAFSHGAAPRYGVPRVAMLDWVNWNDELELTFPQIADRIEAQWLAPDAEQRAAIEAVIAETVGVGI